MPTDARRTVPGARSTVGESARAGWGAWPPPTPGDRPLSMTSRADAAEHAVMATELEQANRTGQPPMALCGAVVDLAPLGATARHVCRPCREAVARRHGTRSTTTPWTLLVQWYEALVRLLRGGLGQPTHKALPTAARLALPAAASTPVPPPVPVDRPVPSPRPRPSAPVRTPHPARGTGGRHRRD